MDKYDRLENQWPELDFDIERNPEVQTRIEPPEEESDIPEFHKSVQYTGTGWDRLGKRLNVRGTIEDIDFALQANSSLKQSLKALEQIAFYLHKGARVPSLLSDYFVDAVMATIECAESHPQYGIDDPSVSEKCLKELGKRLGVLSSGRRVKVHPHLFGKSVEWAQQKHTDNLDCSLSEEEYDLAYEKAIKQGKKDVQKRFKLSDQQMIRYQDAYEKECEERSILMDELIDRLSKKRT